MKNYISKIDLGNSKFAYSQHPTYRKLGLALIEQIEDRWKPPSTFFHLKKGGRIAALRRHADNNYFSKFDIDRFYYKVKKNRIISSLKNTSYSFIDANEVAAHSVVRADHGFCLPYGFVQSSILASLCLDKSGPGKFLRTLRREFPISVYVDDIIISHHNRLGLLIEVSQEAISKFEDGGFAFSKEKTIVGVDRVQAFNIDICRHSLDISDARMELLLDQISNSNRNIQSIGGMINYVQSVNIAQAAKLRSHYDVIQNGQH